MMRRQSPCHAHNRGTRRPPRAQGCSPSSAASGNRTGEFFTTLSVFPMLHPYNDSTFLTPGILLEPPPFTATPRSHLPAPRVSVAAGAVSPHVQPDHAIRRRSPQPTAKRSIPGLVLAAFTRPRAECPFPSLVAPPSSIPPGASTQTVTIPAPAQFLPRPQPPG